MFCRKSTCSAKIRRKLQNGKTVSGSVSSVARQAVINTPDDSVEIPPHIKQRREQQLALFRQWEKKEAEMKAKKAAKKALYEKYVKRPKFYYGPLNFTEGVIATLDQSTPQEEMDAFAVKDRIHDIINKDRYKINGDYFIMHSTMDYPVVRITLDALPHLGKKYKEILNKKLSSLRAPKVSTKEVKEKQTSETRPTNDLNNQKQTASGTTKNLTPSSTQLPQNFRPPQPPATNTIVIDRSTPEEVKSQYAPKSRIHGIIHTNCYEIEGEYLIARRSHKYRASVKIQMDALDLSLDTLRKLVKNFSSSDVPDSLANLLEEYESREAKKIAERTARRKAKKVEKMAAKKKKECEVDLNARIDPQDLDTSPYKENVDPSRKRLMHEQPAENNPPKKAKIFVNPF